MDRAAQEEARRIHAKLVANVEHARTEWDQLVKRRATMMRVGMHASAQAMQGRVNAAHAEWIRAVAALRDFNQGRQ